MAAGLLSAAPAQAAVTLPAGCTSPVNAATAAAVTVLVCTNLSNSANLAQYTNLDYFRLGEHTDNPPAVTTTKLPKLPLNLTVIEINSKAMDVSSLAPLRKLTAIHVSGPTVNDLVSLGKNTGIESLTLKSQTGPGYWGKNLAPLGALSKARWLQIYSHSTVKALANEGSWAPSGFGRGLDGKTMLPENSPYVDGNGNPTGVKSYDFNPTNREVRYNGATKQLQYVTAEAAPKSVSMPAMENFYISVGRSLDVAALSDWAKDKANTVIVSGTRKVGSTLTARHKYGDGMKEYADKFVWKRNGVPIPDAYGKTYRLRTADRGQRITVTATDNKGTGFSAMFRYIPYSQTTLVAEKLP